MKTIATLGWIVLCMVLAGCDTQTEEEKVRAVRIQEYKDEKAEFQAMQDASYARVDQLEEKMSYERVVEILGDTGVRKMSAKAGTIERTIFEWTLDGDIFVKATFDDGILKKWASN